MMHKSYLYITDYIKDPDIEKKVAQSYDVGILTGDLNRSDRKLVQGLLVWHQRIDEQFIKKFPNLKIVVRYGVGFDQIDLDLLSRRRIAFANTPDYGTDEVADTTLAMILNGCRGITQYQAMIPTLTEGSWQENTIGGLERIKEQSLGIIGLGRIGTSVALKSRSLGFNVAFHDPNLPSGYEKSISCRRYNDLTELLNHSDVVTIHTPLNSNTQKLTLLINF